MPASHGRQLAHNPAYYAGSVYFAESTDNITHEVTYLEAVEASGDGFSRRWC